MGYLHGIETLEVLNGARPVEVVRSAIIGVVGTAPAADAAKWPLNQPKLVIGGADAIEGLGATGTLPDAFAALFAQGIGVTAVVVPVAQGADVDATLANVVGAAGPKTGVHAFTQAQPLFGLTPRLMIAPGFTSQRPGNAANPVVSELLGIAQRRRGVVIADGPNTTKEAALTYRQDWGSDRVFMVDPGALVSVNGQPVARPASGYVAGLTARVDRDEGYHVSPSNHVIGGIVGAGRPVDYAMGDPDTEANFLNEHGIATIIRDNGYRLWGNKTTSTDPLTAFLSVRRTHDVIADSIEAAHKVFMDRPFSVQLLLDIANTVNQFLRQLRQRQVILGGRVWIDPGKNTATSWVAGHLFVDYDAEAPAPMERLTFQFNRNTGYYDELAASAAAQIAALVA